MKKILLLVAVILSVSSCELNIFGKVETGNGIPVETPYDLTWFDSISSLGSMDIYYTQDPGAQSVVLTCDENLVEFYVLEVNNGKLNVSVKPGVITRPKTKTFLTVRTQALESVSVAGSGDCVINGDLVSDNDFAFRVSGSGDLVASGTIECKDFSSSVSGSGDVDLNGLIARDAKFTVTGSGDVKVGRITAEQIILKISGSGNGELVCENAGDIEVTITGSGNVHLSGNARSLDTHISGSGRVNQRGLKLGGE